MMSDAVSSSFAYHQMLVLVAGNVCLFGTWVGMRHFARARATQGSTRYGWLLYGLGFGTGAALWPSSTPSASLSCARPRSAERLLEPWIATVRGWRSASVAKRSPDRRLRIGWQRHFTLAPELGGLLMGIGILAMHFLGLVTT